MGPLSEAAAAAGLVSASPPLLTTGLALHLPPPAVQRRSQGPFAFATQVAHSRVPNQESRRGHCLQCQVLSAKLLLAYLVPSLLAAILVCVLCAWLR